MLPRGDSESNQIKQDTEKKTEFYAHALIPKQQENGLISVPAYGNTTAS